MCVYLCQFFDLLPTICIYPDLSKFQMVAGSFYSMAAELSAMLSTILAMNMMTLSVFLSFKVTKTCIMITSLTHYFIQKTTRFCQLTFIMSYDTRKASHQVRDWSRHKLAIFLFKHPCHQNGAS